MNKFICIAVTLCCLLFPMQAIAQCGSTPAGYSLLGELSDHRYYISDANFNHSQASAAAAANGGYMLSIVESLENEFIRSRISKIIRIGLSDAGTEGFLQWDSGESFRLNNIITGNNNNENDFGSMNFWNGGWDMEGKSVARPYVLEVECNTGPAEIADLTISNTDVTVPSDVTAGTAFPISFAVTNVGGTAVSGYEVNVRLTADGVVRNSDPVLYQRQVQADLAPGQQLLVNESVTLPADLAASDYIMIFRVDPDNEITELRESNNQINKIVQVASSGNGGGPSSCPSTISGYSNMGTLNDHAYFLSNETENWTTASGLASQLNGYLASIGSSSENEFLKNGINEITLIGYNDAASEGNFAWDSGENIGYTNLSVSNAGDKDFANMNFWNGGWALDSGQVSRRYIVEFECNSNNTGGGRADLSLSNVSPIPVGNPGDVVSFTFDLTNSGNAIANESYTIGMYLSVDGVLDSSDPLVGEIGTGNTPLGTTNAVTGAITIPASTAPSNYTLILDADINNTVTESDENNNIVSKQFTVGGVAGSCPSPSITSTQTTPTNPVGISVIWNPVGPADSYLVEYTNTSTSSNVTNTATTTFSNIQLINGIAFGQDYSIRVRSICGGQQSAFSGSVGHFTQQGEANVSLGSFRNLQAVPPNAPNLITADISIFNSGLIAATFELRTYLSTDNVLSADDIRLNRANQPDGQPQILTLSCCFSSSETGGVYSIPGGLTSGDYFFIAVIDEDNQVPGVSGTLSRQITIDPAPDSLPNLFMGLIQFAQPVVSPSSLQIDYEVVNSGNGDANGSFNVEIFISPNDGNPANDILLATRTISGGIPRAGRTSDSVSVDIPDLPAGEYRLIFIADSENQIVELNDSNTALRIFDLEEADDNGGNECPGTISGFSVMGELNGSKYYLSNDSENWPAAAAITRTHSGHLASINNAAENTFLKERINEITLIGLTDKASEGTFVWDSGEGLTYSNITGSNSNSNDYANMNFWNGGWDFDSAQVARRYIMEVPCGGGNNNGGGQPDLNVSNLSAVPSGRPGDVLNYTFNLNNFQPVTASASYRIGMYISDDSILSSEDVLAGIVPTGNTPEGTITAVPGAITVPTSTSPGNYFLIVKADIDEVIAETIETNNIATRNFTVTAGSASGIDLEVDVVVDKAVHQDWTNFTYTVTATNTGTESATGIRLYWNLSDPDNMAYVDVSLDKGSSNGWDGIWKGLELNAGESAELEVTYFFKAQNTPSTLYVQVSAADQNDVDSLPANGLNIDFIVSEDDEAKVTVAAP